MFCKFLKIAITSAIIFGVTLPSDAQDFLRPDQGAKTTCPVQIESQLKSWQLIFSGQTGWSTEINIYNYKDVELEIIGDQIRCHYSMSVSPLEKNTIFRKLPSIQCELYQKGSRFPSEAKNLASTYLYLGRQPEIKHKTCKFRANESGNNNDECFVVCPR